MSRDWARKSATSCEFKDLNIKSKAATCVEKLVKFCERSSDIWTSEPALKTTSKKVSHFNSFFFFFFIKVPPDYLIHNCLFVPLVSYFYTHQTYNSNDSPSLGNYTHYNTHDPWSYLAPKWLSKTNFWERNAQEKANEK